MCNKITPNIEYSCDEYRKGEVRNPRRASNWDRDQPDSQDFCGSAD